MLWGCACVFAKGGGKKKKPTGGGAGWMAGCQRLPGLGWRSSRLRGRIPTVCKARGRVTACVRRVEEAGKPHSKHVVLGREGSSTDSSFSAPAFYSSSFFFFSYPGETTLKKQKKEGGGREGGREWRRKKEKTTDTPDGEGKGKVGKVKGGEEGPAAGGSREHGAARRERSKRKES